jgi:2-iminobutanoate/2-iminopropanoate deaminase
MKKQIVTNQAPAAIGPYAQAIEADGLVFCSGQIALDHRSGHLVSGGIEAEVRCVMGNLTEVLRASGLGLSDVVKTTIFLIDLRDFDIVNRIYDEHFDAPYPARSTVQVAALPRGARVEIEAIASVSSRSGN